MGIIKQCTHSHSLTPIHPTYPKYFSTHPHPPKIMSHSPPFTSTHPEYFRTHLHPLKMFSPQLPPTPNNVSHTPFTPAHPKYFSNHSHLFKIMPQPLLITQNISHLIPTHQKYGLTNLSSSSKLLIYQVIWPFQYKVK